MKRFAVLFLLAVAARAQTVTTQTSAKLVDVGLITVFSETLTAASYANGVLTLSDGTRVGFANGSVTVQSATSNRRRAVRR